MISIEFLKKSFKVYGDDDGCLQRIELFSDDHNGTKFAHITFTKNQIAYLALIDCHLKLQSKNIEIIRPADVHLQPDNPVDSSLSPFYNLPDDCLLAILDYCEIDTSAMLSTVCKKFHVLLATRVFANTPKFDLVATNDADVENALIAVSRLVQCLDPSVFHLKMVRNLWQSHQWPAISVNMTSSESKITVEMDFFKPNWLKQLDKIAKRIKCIHVHRSIYDSDDALGKFDGETFPNATNLIITGYAIRCDIPDLTSIVASLPKLNAISLQKGIINWDHVVSYCSYSHQLRNINFQKCCFNSAVDAAQIYQIAHVIKGRHDNSRLGLMFDRIRTTTSSESAFASSNSSCFSELDSISCVSNCDCKDPKEIPTYIGIKEALVAARVGEYVYAKIGSDPIAD